MSKAPKTRPGDADDVDPAKLSFEEAAAEIESIITRIDAGEIGLEESMRQHARGRMLIERCRIVVDGAQKELDRLAVPAAGDATESADNAPADGEDNLPF
jgi:exodeoxyribonuclease VII small subunit